MKILVLSDLHFEFQADQGRAFVERLPSEVDVVLLAGDICSAEMIESTADLFCSKYPHVIQIAGNHEYYQSSWSEVERKFKAAEAQYSNLHYLNKSSVEIDGQRFLGATLWFPYQNSTKWDIAKWSMADFHVIEEFESWVYRENEDATEFLTNEMNESDIVLTHHLPSYDCVALPYIGSSLNSFFVSSMHTEIHVKQPKYWFFGHTHESISINIGKTKLLSNPFGYAGHGTNPKFNPNFIIEV